MRLASDTHGEGTAHVQLGGVDGAVAEGVAVATHGFLGNLVQTDALDRGGGAGEILLDHLGVEAHGVENLRAAVGLIG